MPVFMSFNGSVVDFPNAYAVSKLDVHAPCFQRYLPSSGLLEADEFGQFFIVHSGVVHHLQTGI